MSDDQLAPSVLPTGKPSSWLRIGIIAGPLLGLLLLLAGYGYWTLFRPIALAETQIVTITQESSLQYVARRLHERRIIAHPTAFRLYARLTGRADELKIGEYEITSGMTPAQVLDLLVSGRARVFRLVIPEGKWASEIGPRVAQQWPDAALEFPQLVEQPARFKEQVAFPIEGTSLEGYLFPDTYRLPSGATADEIIAKMLERFQVTCWAAYQANPPRDGRSLHEVLILASLVEGEAKKDEERPIIAGVYMNRLRTPGWTLDCDATLIYARKQRLSRVLNRDKLIDSPYNSYQRPGLPPGPINNPGLKSFQAALQPAQVEYFFYVARSDGSHVFARTLDEHTANIRRYRGK